VVVAKSPIDRIMNVARERGWTSLRLLSSAANTYNRDYHGENEKGDQLPSLNVFVQRDGAFITSTRRSCCSRRPTRDRTAGTST
jgi:predicted dithiol-disulfide oxidoreductase (DUF899 family)